MIHEITMPKLGMMDGDINLSEWYVKEGDKVAAGQELCEIESQKITNKIETKIDGTVLKIFTYEGDEVPIGTLLALIGEESDDVSKYL